MRTLKFLIAGIAALTLFLGGCSQNEEKPVAKEQQPVVVKKASRVLVPDDVRGKWKAVRVKVTDKTDSTEATYTVDLGYEFTVAKSDVKVRVENFLPAFVMQGTIMTSASNDLRNPAAQIVITEGDKEIYKGWLFSRFPDTHAFQHERFSFSLVDFVPVKEKKG